MNTRWHSIYHNTWIVAALSIYIFFIATPFAFGQETSPATVSATTTEGTPLPFFFLSIIPEEPQPGSAAVATIVFPNTTSLKSIDWFIDKKKQSQPINPSVLVFTAPSNTSGHFEIQATATSVDGQQYTQIQNVLLNPFDDVLKIQEKLMEKLHKFERQYGPLDAPLFQRPAAIDRPIEPGSKSALFSIVSNVQNPKPFDTVTLYIQSSAFNPDQVYIEWYENNKKVAAGSGRKLHSVKLGNLGKRVDVRATVLMREERITNSISLVPFSVSLYWWADTLVPRWYTGKALPTKDQLVHVSAFTPLGVASPSNVIYMWKLNGEPRPEESGLGKQTFSFRSRFPGLPDTVSVLIQNPNKTFSFERSVTIANTDPEVRLCIIDLIRGCARSNTLRNIIMPTNALTVQAYPFYFGSKEAPFLAYNWNINGSKPTIAAQEFPWLLTIETPPKNFIGTLTVAMTIRSIITLLQADIETSVQIQ